MNCFVYRAEKRIDTYVYLRDKDAFALLPAELIKSLGPFTWVMALDLTPDRKLARADAAIVCANLHKIGYHIQFPPPAI